jgi:hypothetical protein
MTSLKEYSDKILKEKLWGEVREVEKLWGEVREVEKLWGEL